MTRPRKNPGAGWDSNPGSSTLEADALTTRPARRWSARCWPVFEAYTHRRRTDREKWEDLGNTDRQRKTDRERGENQADKERDMEKEIEAVTRAVFQG